MNEFQFSFQFTLSHPKCSLVFKKIKSTLRTIQKKRLQQNVALKMRVKTRQSAKSNEKGAANIGKQKKTMQSTTSPNIESEGAMNETPAELVHHLNSLYTVDEPQLSIAMATDDALSFGTLETTMSDTFSSSPFDVAQCKDYIFGGYLTNSSDRYSNCRCLHLLFVIEISL